MRFRRQLYIGLGALIALITTMAATGILALHVTSRGEDSLARSYADDLALANRLQLLVERVVAASRGYLLSGDQSLRQQFEETKQQLEALLVQEHGPDLADIDRATRAYLQAAADAVDRRSKLTDPDPIVKYFDRILVADTSTLDSVVSSFARRRRAAFESAIERMQAIAGHAQVALVLSSILAIGCGLALAYVVSRRLSRQFKEVETATEAAKRAASARQEILAIVSHDLRNPLHAITMGASLVEDTTREDVTRKCTGTIRNAAERMQHMIDELLETSRIDSGQVELHRAPALAHDLIDRSVELFRARAADRQIELVTAVRGGTVHADAERVIEILSNLIGNALKFAGGGTRVVVSAEPQGARMRFAVADQGPGIAAGELPRVFDRYFQSERSRTRDGLGLGLHICKWLVEAHGGTIGVDTVVGQGSTFWFELPAA